jgi:putative phosphonate transport system ATP-binding protein
MPKILEINSLSKIYGKGCSYCNKIIYEKSEESICPECNSVLALKDISFSIKKGDRFGIVGD